MAPNTGKRREKRVEGGDELDARPGVGSSAHLKLERNTVLTAGTASRCGTRLSSIPIRSVRNNGSPNSPDRMSATVSAVRSTTQAVKHMLRRTNRQKPTNGRSARTKLVLCGALIIGTLTGCETLPLTEAELGEPPPEIPDGGERWICRSDRHGATGDGHVVLTRDGPQDSGMGFGQVLVAGVTHDAMFSVQGVNRRWDWNGVKDTMLIKPGGKGSYYNFRLVDDKGQVKGSSWFECHQR